MLYNAIVIAGQFDRNMKVFQKNAELAMQEQSFGTVVLSDILALFSPALVCYSLRMLETWAVFSSCATQIADNVVISDY